MADRQPGKDWTLYAKLPNTGLSGDVSLTDSKGVSDDTGTIVEVGERLYSVALSPTSTEQGVWKAVWDYGSGTLEQDFSVGPDSGTSLYILRYMVARRINGVYRGVIDTASDNTLTDLNLIGGGGVHNGKWVLLEPSSGIPGIFKRVSDFNGNVLELSSSFPLSPDPGTEYLLFDEELQPSAIDAAIDTIVESFSSACLVKLQTTNLTPDSNGNVDVPAGWDYVTEIWNTDTSGALTRVTPDGWSCGAGRKVSIPDADTTWNVTMYGARNAAEPLYEDSVIDFPSITIIPGIARILHLDQARGNATDYDAHIGRAGDALQEFGAMLGARLPRFPRDATLVLD